MADSANQTTGRRLVAGVGVLALVMSSMACVSLTPQLHPTDVKALEQLEEFDERNAAYNDNAIYRKVDPRGVRYVKGTRLGARARGWQSLDLILRSDRNSAAALPERKIRAARVLTGFMIASGVVLFAGIAASSREGLDLSRLTGTGAILLGGGVATLGLGIATGVVWGQAKTGYENAVNVYNDSLALRLGITDADGNFKVPEGLLVDEEGFIILDQKELLIPELQRGSAPSKPEPAPPAEPAPIAPVEGPVPAPEQPAPEQPAPEQPEQPDEDRKVGASTASLVGPSRGAP